MAERRMFAKTIIDSDAFLDMALSTQALYMHLAMRADDDGFINSPKKIAKMIGASDDEMKILHAKKFIISFESGIVVIKHWKIHNYIQKDRYKETLYHEEMSLLSHDKNNGYKLDAQCIQDVSTGKGRLELGEVRLELYNAIISDLNQKAKSSYRPTTGKTKSLIDARLNEGFELNDFIHVNTVKCAEWLGNENEKYLRPETLYGTKFEGYLNQKITDKVKANLVMEHTGMSALDIINQATGVSK